jgi:hypothetical protein
MIKGQVFGPESLTTILTGVAIPHKYIGKGEHRSPMPVFNLDHPQKAKDRREL